jgi:DNA-binding CsgD family transcriptional regulator
MNTSIIENVVSEFIQKGQLFTSIDIANEVKTRGEWIRNTEVAGFLRKNVISLARQQNLDYEMVQVSVSTSTGSAQANVYFMSGDDPHSYTNTTQTAMTPAEFLQLHPGKTVPGYTVAIQTPSGYTPVIVQAPIGTKTQDPEDEKSVKSLKDRFDLTQREAETAAFMLEGKTIAEISTLMGIVPQSVYAYRHEIKLKLDARNSKAPVAVLLENLLSLDVTKKSSQSQHAAVNFVTP